jgi:hypothetical protein
MVAEANPHTQDEFQGEMLQFRFKKSAFDPGFNWSPHANNAIEHI